MAGKGSFNGSNRFASLEARGLLSIRHSTAWHSKRQLLRTGLFDTIANSVVLVLKFLTES